LTKHPKPSGTLSKLPKIRSVSVVFVLLLFIVSACYSPHSGTKRTGASRTQKHYRPGGNWNAKAKSQSKPARRTEPISKQSRVPNTRAEESEEEDYFDFDESTARRTGSRNKGGKNVDAQVSTVIKAARSYTGTPYRYGGTTRKGMDCSGLLCVAFQSADIHLPRTSQEQSTYGRTVPIRNLEPGDLVFFSGKKGSNKITHVGMVTEVKGRENVMFIHASTSRGVREDNLYSDYFKGVFVKAIRPF
jgi:probable lipoprotein NlpC